MLEVVDWRKRWWQAMRLEITWSLKIRPFFSVILCWLFCKLQYLFTRFVIQCCDKSRSMEVFASSWMTVCSYYFMSSRVLSCEYCFDYQIKWRNQRRGEKDWMQCACKLLSLNFQLMLQVLQCLFPFLIHWLKPLQLWQCRRSHVLLGLIFTQTQCQHSLIARRVARLVIRTDQIISHLPIIVVLLWHSFHHLF